MASWFEVAGYGFQEFSAGGVRTFAIVEGRDSGFPVLLLHGTPGASFVWSTTIRSLGRGRRIIAPDLPGWGRSQERPKRHQAALSRNGLRAWVSEVIAAQQLGQFDLVGRGDGALLALELLLHTGPRIRRLGLLNLPLKMKPNQAIRWPWQRAEWQRNKLEDWLVKESGLSRNSREQVGPLFKELFGGGWYAERSPVFPVSEFERGLEVYRGALSRFGGETLLAWGAGASGYDVERSGRFCDNRTPLVWPESANFPMWEQPQLYEFAIKDFLGS
ncbi:MAG: alpha/beta hydrolase [bacterium]|nr:alpha/beta hydrolase [bacterium]